MRLSQEANLSWWMWKSSTLWETAKILMGRRVKALEEIRICCTLVSHSWRNCSMSWRDRWIAQSQSQSQSDMFFFYLFWTPEYEKRKAVKIIQSLWGKFYILENWYLLPELALHLFFSCHSVFKDLFCNTLLLMELPFNMKAGVKEK